MLYETTDPKIVRIHDSNNQLDVVVKYVSLWLCKPATNFLNFRPVLGTDRVVASWIFVNSSKRDAKISNKIWTSRLCCCCFVCCLVVCWLFVLCCAHYIRVIAVKMSNGIAEEIRALQCKIQETAHTNAITTAQYNGWLAASYFNLPNCTEHQPTGKNDAVLQFTSLSS